MNNILDLNDNKFSKILYHRSGLIIAIIVLLLSIFYGRYQGNYIVSDGKGYYAYLPALFIYDDINFNFIDDYEGKYYKPEEYVDFRTQIDGQNANIGFVGTAVTWIPFFVGAHLGSYILGLPTDGYAPLYQFAVGLAAVFYLFLGLWAVKRLLEIYKVKRLIILIIQVILVFATPVLYYTMVEASFSHMSSFAMISLFALSIKQYAINYRGRDLMLASLFFALVVLIRPTNGIVIVSIPFFCGSWKDFQEMITRTFRMYKTLILAFLITFAILAVQPLLYYFQVGKFFVDTYSNVGDHVGFNWLHPAFVDILISYKKGLFIYTPVLLFSLLGFFYLFRKSNFLGLSMMVYLFIMIYVLSAWWNWWYGMSFGNRAFIDHFAYFALLFGFASKDVKFPSLKYVILIVAPFMIALNVIQMYQYRNYILFWDMNEKMYWEVFLKTDSKYVGKLWKNEKLNAYYLEAEKHKDKINKGNGRVVFSFDFDTDSLNSGIRFLNDTEHFRGRMAQEISQQNIYSYGLVKPIGVVTNKQSFVFKASAKVYVPGDPDENSFALVVSIEQDGNPYFYAARGSEIMELPEGKWNSIDLVGAVDKIKTREDIMKMYLYYWGNEKIYLDDMKLELFPR